MRRGPHEARATARRRGTLCVALRMLPPSHLAQAAEGSPAALVEEPYRNRLTALSYISYSPQTKLQFGVGGWYQFKWPAARADTGTRSPHLTGGAAYTTKGQWGTSFPNSTSWGRTPGSFGACGVICLPGCTTGARRTPG